MVVGKIYYNTPLSLKEDKDIVCAIGNNGMIRHIYGPVRHLNISGCCASNGIPVL
jgi:hypothetical protein